MPGEYFWKKENSAANTFLVSSAAWFAVGTLLGLDSAIHFVAPDFFANISWLEFGRARPAHVNTMLFGFVTMMLLGSSLYIAPKVLQTKLFSEPMGNLSALFFNLAIFWGGLTLLLGHSQGREYAEYIWSADLFVVIAYILILLDLVLTITTRTERLLYVSVWYFVGAIAWTGVLYPIGNVMWNYPSGAAHTGIVDAIFMWHYGHNIFGLSVTPLAIGVGYYMFPRIVRAPLYSQALSIIGFWSLLLFYTHIGGHHLLQAPIPTWLKTVSIIDSWAMMLPVATVLVNWWYTSRGRFGSLMAAPAPKFLLVGSIWYAIVCIQGPVQSLAWVQRITHFNQWVVGHAHIAVLGFTGFIALAGMFYVLPNTTGRKIYSQKLVNVQYWLIMLGLINFFLVLTAAGLIQGMNWNNGETVYRTVPLLKPYMVFRLAGGLMIAPAAFIGLYNVLMTFWRGERVQV